MLQGLFVGCLVKAFKDIGMSFYFYHFILVICVYKMLDNWVTKSDFKTEFNMAGKCILHPSKEMKLFSSGCYCFLPPKE